MAYKIENEVQVNLDKKYSKQTEELEKLVRHLNRNFFMNISTDAEINGASWSIKDDGSPEIIVKYQYAAIENQDWGNKTKEDTINEAITKEVRKKFPQTQKSRTD